MVENDILKVEYNDSHKTFLFYFLNYTVRNLVELKSVFCKLANRVSSRSKKKPYNYFEGCVKSLLILKHISNRIHFISDFVHI